MRRWFSIVLIAFLPLQFSWAAVAMYGGHEADAQAQHLGHHTHQHASHADMGKSADPSSPDGAAAADFDCGHCHSSCCGLPTAARLPAPLALALHPVAAAQGVVRTLAQNPPERPQWRRFA